MTYADALAYFDSFINYEMTPLNASLPRYFNLERMERLLDALGNPHRDFPVVHVAGTKGKGSTCAFLYSVLRAAGYRIGLYTQPHLISPRERFQADGACISESDLADLTTELRPKLEAHRQTEYGRLTFFEAYTAMVFLWCARLSVDIAVIEVGMGGRLDATNVANPLVSVITPIGLDHVAALGNTVERIAKEKAGIIKPGRPVVVSPQEAAADQAIREIAERQGAPRFHVGSEMRVERHGIQDGRERCDIKWRDHSLDGLRLRMLGAQQTENAATAIAAIQLLRDDGWNVSDVALRQGLETARIHGRFQLTTGMDGRPLILDVAHTAESGKALRRLLQETLPSSDITLIVGMSSDKDAGAFAEALAPAANRVVTTRAADIPRAADPESLAEAWRKVHPSVAVENQLQKAVANAEGEVLCVTGSVYIVGEALETVAPEALKTFRHEVGL